MTKQEQIDQLKAQVNCLREALIDQRSRYHVAKDLDMVLDATPEQCLAEVKAKAIESVGDAMRSDSNYTYNDGYYISYIYMQADKVREQAK